MLPTWELARSNVHECVGDGSLAQNMSHSILTASVSEDGSPAARCLVSRESHEKLATKEGKLQSVHKKDVVLSQKCTPQRRGISL